MPARVFLDDRVILEGEAERVHPRAGQILTVRAVPAGGGRSKDVELLTIVVAAIAAAATYGTSAYLEASTTFFASATQAGGSSYLAGAVLAGIQGAIAEGAKFALAQAVNVLIPAPSTPTPRAVSTPQSYTVSGTANGAAPFSPIPKIYGARRIFPQYAASPYTEVSGEDQYLRMLFLLGYGPLDISQINIADTAIEDYKDIEWELRAGFTDDAPSRLYPGSVAEQDFSIVLSTTEVDKAPSLSGWMTQTSGPLADELSVDVTFPGGLNAFNSKGAPIPIQCTWQIQWAPAGTQNWTSEPDIVIKSGGVGAVRRGHVWRVPRGQYDVQMQLVHFALYEGDWSTNYTADGQWTALRTIRAQAPYTMAGLATLALRIRASRQLNGVCPCATVYAADSATTLEPRSLARLEAIGFPQLRRLSFRLQSLSFVRTFEPKLGRRASGSFLAYRIRPETACSVGYSRSLVASKTRRHSQRWRRTCADGRYQRLPSASETKTGHTQRALKAR
jgi:predicted phage tail protein